MRSVGAKIETMNLRVSLPFKLVLRGAAKKDQRWMVNILEGMLGKHCGENGIVITHVQNDAFVTRKNPSAVRKDKRRAAA